MRCTQTYGIWDTEKALEALHEEEEFLELSMCILAAEG